MTNKDLFRAIGEVREDQILDAETQTAKTAPPWRKYGAIAACLALLLAGGFALAQTARWNALMENFHPLPAVSGGTGNADSGGLSGDSYTLDGDGYTLDGQEIVPAPSYSVNAEIGQLSGPGNVSSSACLADAAWLTPEEIFAQDTVIFRGTVRELQYYRVDLAGTPTYYTRASVEVTDCLRGNLGAGDVYGVVYLGAKGYEVNSLSGPLAELDVGDEAVFMPVWTTPETGWREGESYFCYADLGQLYLSEGMRYVFAETADGLDFSRSAYEEIADAETLDEVTDYIRGMIGTEEPEKAVLAETPITPQAEPSRTEDAWPSQATDPSAGPGGARELPGGAYVGDE